jgi:Zn-dependent M28 family amino/carboxypeptidase
LQQIADRYGGHRAAGSAGEDASLNLVASRLRAAGFEVDTPTFRYSQQVVLARSLTVDGQQVEAERLEDSTETPAGGVSGPLVVVPVDDSTGCQGSDLAGLATAGSLLVVRRGGCPFAAKADRAAEAGAAAVVVVNDAPEPLRDATVGSSAAVPVAGVSGADGTLLEALAGRRGTLDLRSETQSRTSRNVVAQTRTGRTDDVVMVGGHLDSVGGGPGINDNGSGVAGLLELALTLGSEPEVERAVRFAWWGAEEVGLLGSQAYVRGLGAAGRRDLGLYLNVDMIASPNPGYFVYDGDDSAGQGAGPGPSGSADIERTLAGYLAGRGIRPEPTDFDGRSDYGPFIAVGVPAGGLFSGADAAKTADQAEHWGGAAGDPFDPCYHQACDDLDNIDRTAFHLHLDALAWAVGHYASSTPSRTPPPVGPATVPPALAPAAARRSVCGRRSPDGARRLGSLAPR